MEQSSRTARRRHSVLDRSDATERGSDLGALVGAGFLNKVDRKRAIAHLEVMIVNEHVVLIGSFNFMAAADASDAERCLAVADAAVPAKHRVTWRAHGARAEPPTKGVP